MCHIQALVRLFGRDS